ncbi:delta(24)-sterol reductase [Gorgonomyces haynaldii]|nr:delta(24)-sterol reductase [Gorgonomyces haynaldii]
MSVSKYVNLAVNKVTDNLPTFVTDFLTEYRGVIALFVLLPMSFFYQSAFYVYRTLFFIAFNSPEKHDQRVKDIQEQVKRAKGTKMCTARPGFLATSLKSGVYKKTMTNIKIDLYDILSVDTAKRTVRVEPMASMGSISRRLIPLGWTLAITPELDDLTVGGLIMGFGVETSSHKYGLFQHICTAFEIVLADGSLVRCTKDENPELFYAIPWSHGTLGFLVAAELQIIPAKKFVELVYYPCKTKAKAVEIFDRESNNMDNDFVEGLMYSEETAVIMVGRLTDNYTWSEYNAIGNSYKPWFYKHVESILDKGRIKREFIPLRDYFHRHTKPIFWEMADIIPFGNSFLFRYLLGWMLPIPVSLLKLTQTDAIKRMYTEKHVNQDMLVPMSTLSESLKVFHEEYNLYPLWLCPMVLPKENEKYPGLVKAPANETTMYVDIGAYGNPAASTFNAVESGRRVEHFVRKVQGFQALYADTYMSREEFRDMFDHKLYDQIRKRYQADLSFPDIYDKVNRHARA